MQIRQTSFPSQRLAEWSLHGPVDVTDSTAPVVRTVEFGGRKLRIYHWPGGSRWEFA